jgi:tRNA pseudouridine38-40 synthase
LRILKLIVAYDGAAFAGWQRQPGRRTVQGVLEEHLGAVLEETVSLTGAGRTDTGCHARGQVASLATHARLPAHALPPVLNRRLPADVRVRAAADAPAGFDARRSALARRYAYRLLREDDVLLSRFAWHPRSPIDADRLAWATVPLEGEHDCAAFQAAGGHPTVTRCTVMRATWRPWEGGLQLDIVANHFLYRMVRSIVGTVLTLQGAADPAREMRACLASRDRACAGPTAPAHGLCLEQVFYAAGGVR